MKQHKNISAALMVSALVSALAGCGGSSGESTPTPSPTVIGVATPSQISVVTAK